MIQKFSARLLSPLPDKEPAPRLQSLDINLKRVHAIGEICERILDETKEVTKSRIRIDLLAEEINKARDLNNPQLIEELVLDIIEEMKKAIGYQYFVCQFTNSNQGIIYTALGYQTPATRMEMSHYNGDDGKGVDYHGAHIYYEERRAFLKIPGSLPEVVYYEEILRRIGKKLSIHS